MNLYLKRKFKVNKENGFKLKGSLRKFDVRSFSCFLKRETTLRENDFSTNSALGNIGTCLTVGPTSQYFI